MKALQGLSTWEGWTQEVVTRGRDMSIYMYPCKNTILNPSPVLSTARPPSGANCSSASYLEACCYANFAKRRASAANLPKKSTNKVAVVGGRAEILDV